TYLDALLGLVPARTHSAERALRREHESLLSDWARASLAFYRAHNSIQTVETVIGCGFAVWIMHRYLAQGGEPRGLLLLLYWALNLLALTRWLGEIAQQYPVQRNIVLRLLEPLSAPEEDTSGQVVGCAGVAAAPTQHADASQGDQADTLPRAAAAAPE